MSVNYPVVWTVGLLTGAQLFCPSRSVCRIPGEEMESLMSPFNATAAVSVQFWDKALHRIARRLSKVSRIEDAGAFRHHNSTPFFDFWREDYPRGGCSYTLRLGITELVIDLSGKAR